MDDSEEGSRYASQTKNVSGGVPCYVVQRGNNRDACFFTDDDFRFYREALSDASRRYQVDVHA